MISTWSHSNSTMRFICDHKNTAKIYRPEHGQEAVCKSLLQDSKVFRASSSQQVRTVGYICKHYMYIHLNKILTFSISSQLQLLLPTTMAISSQGWNSDRISPPHTFRKPEEKAEYCSLTESENTQSRQASTNSFLRHRQTNTHKHKHKQVK